ncbi:uncharacterized protein TNIN_496521 [Trichonephila inaurata madagascariensis]|uniref:Peptidase aspartic putative domain-containing protein n=1 Tax=Trichonephila inaurata madagascariensis TaxID=2747483 RepID=A0A8X6XKG2_9ARAC|nr:uncharacterized protein TNIN_496521 [Trichonephila inaurata madagascariensis]
MFKGAKKEDLRQIAFELGQTVTDNMTVVQLTNVIKSNETFVNEPEFVKDIANTIISERKLEKESELELERIKFERTKAELELARIQAESKIEIENEPEKTESLDSLIKSVRTLTVKVPSKPEGVFLSETKSPKCVLLCNENHPLYKCPKYKKLSFNDRVELVKTNNFCFNCLLRNHKSSACKSKYSCGMCQRRHHVTLHFRPADKQSGLIDDSGAKKSSVLSSTAAEFHTSAREEVNHELVNPQFAATGYNNSDNKTVLLSTCICYVTDGSGNVYPIRALMDVGASSNFMSQGLADRLRLRKEKTNISVSGLNNFSL